MTGALLAMPAGAVVLFAMWLLAEQVLAGQDEWERVQALLGAWAYPRTAGGAVTGLPMLQPDPSPAVSILPGCTCPGCECARLLKMDGGQS
jgi:hypothetical protein